MVSRIWLINLVLAAAVLFFGIKALNVWTQEELSPPEIKPVKEPAISEERIKSIKKRVSSELVYESIAAMNLFASDRKESSTEGDESSPADELKEKREDIRTEGFLKRITLYGVVIVDDYMSALVNNPRPKPGDPRIMSVKVGDSVGDFNIAEIKRESIIVTRDGENHEINLYDKERPKERRIETTVVKKLPAVEEKAKEAKTKNKTEELSEKSSMPLFGPVPRSKKTVQESPDSKNVGEAEEKVIRTPFGDILNRTIRKNP